MQLRYELPQLPGLIRHHTTRGDTAAADFWSEIAVENFNELRRLYQDNSKETRRLLGDKPVVRTALEEDLMEAIGGPDRWRAAEERVWRRRMEIRVAPPYKAAVLRQAR